MTSAPPPKDLPLYERLLGPAWPQLSPAIQRAHHVTEQLDSAGHFDIIRGCGFLARLLLPWMGMPPAGQNVPTRLRMLRRGECEEWLRSFGEFPLNSIQHIHTRSVLAERFGRFEVRFRVEVRSGGICYRQCRGAVRLIGCWLPLPMWLSTRIDAAETPGQAPNRTRVHVTVRLPLAGLLLEYRGEMETQENRS